jgi:hypothetical protein
MEFLGILGRAVVAGLSGVVVFELVHYLAPALPKIVSKIKRLS